MKIKNLLAIFMAVALQASVFEVYVFAENSSRQIWVDAVNGKDDNGGYSINDAFATIGRAKREAALINSDMSGDIEIIIRGGDYKINVYEREYNVYEYDYNDDKTIAEKNVYKTIKVNSTDLNFTAEDSGTNGYSVVYKAYNDEAPKISGERVIDGWTVYDEEKGIYWADAKGIVTRSLYVDGKRAVRARSEYNVMNSISALPDVTKTAFGHTTTDLSMAQWNNIKDVEFVYMDPKGWVAPRVKVEKVFVSGNVLNVKMQNPAWNILEYVWYKRDNYTFSRGPMYIENAFELLDSPGEWYLDKVKDKIYYMPRSGEQMDNITVPYAEELVSLEDAENIRFEGIEFCGTTYLRPDFGYIDAQSNGIRENPDGFEDEAPISAVSLKYCKNIVFSGCSFERLGSNAINILEGCKNIDIDGCELNDISGTAVMVGGVSSEYRNITDIVDVISDIDIVNNKITDSATDFVSGVGISVGMAGNVNIRNNEISNLNYSGLHIGWGIYSDAEEASAQNFGLLKNIRIENNLIYDTNILMRDGAPIYVRGKTGADMTSPNMIRGNYIKSSQVNGCAIYFDCGVGSWLAENNVCEDCDYIFSGQAFKDYHIGDGNYLMTPKEKVVLDTYKGYSGIKKIIKVENQQWPDAAKRIMSNAGIENKAIECFSLHNKSGMTIRMAPGQIISPQPEIYGSNGERTDTDAEITYYKSTYLNGKVYDRYMLGNDLLVPLEDSDEIKIISDGRFQILKPGKRAILAVAKTDNAVLLRHIDIICGENIEAAEYSFVPQNEQYSYITESAEWPEYHIPRFNDGGGYIEYTILPPEEAGNYELWFTQIGNEQISWYNAINKGIFQFSIDGVDIGEAVDFHSITDTNVYIGRYYYDGRAEIKLRLTNTGKNADSTDYRVSIDSFFFNKAADDYIENSGAAERIKITGKTGYTNGRMSIVAKNSSGSLVFADQIRCSDNGFSTDFGVVRQGLSENEELDITISSPDMDKPYRNSFKINRQTQNGLRITAFSITNSNGVAINEIDTSSVVCVNASLENTTDGTVKAMLVGAIYDKSGKLIDVDMRSAEEITDEVSLNVNIPTDGDTDVLKIMILDSKQNLTPIYEVENYQVNSENIFISIY